MIDILNYTFFQNALWAILLISITSAIIGTYIVARRMLFITGGITHASFGGLGVGYYLGINPTLSALVFAILSALGVEWLSRGKRIRRFLGDRHERVYLRRIDAVCGDRSDNGRCVPDLGGAYDTYGQCAAFILRDLHGGTVQRYEAV